MKKSQVWISVLLILLVLSWIGFDYLDYVNVEREALPTEEPVALVEESSTAESTTQKEAAVSPEVSTEGATESATEVATEAATEVSTKVTTEASAPKPTPSSLISYIFRNQDLYDQHYNKHGHEFGDITKEEYLKLANELFTSGKALTKTESDGDLLFYDVESNTFGVLSQDGYIRTCFKPDDGIEYWNRQ